MQDEIQQRRRCGQQLTTNRKGRDALRDAIVQEETLLATLEAQQVASKHRLAALRAELIALDTEPEIRVHEPLTIEAPVPRTSAEKVKLFRSLFRGRMVVFPTRFVSKRTGESGNSGLDVAMIQSLVRKDSVQDILAHYG